MAKISTQRGRTRTVEVSRLKAVARPTDDADGAYRIFLLRSDGKILVQYVGEKGSQYGTERYRTGYKVSKLSDSVVGEPSEALLRTVVTAAGWTIK
jgi:hypothetical protein